MTSIKSLEKQASSLTNVVCHGNIKGDREATRFIRDAAREELSKVSAELRQRRQELRDDIARCRELACSHSEAIEQSLTRVLDELEARL